MANTTYTIKIQTLMVKLGTAVMRLSLCCRKNLGDAEHEVRRNGKKRRNCTRRFIFNSSPVLSRHNLHRWSNRRK